MTHQRRNNPEPTEALVERAGREPLGIDISDYSDEWCAGFLAGQANGVAELTERLAAAKRDRDWALESAKSNHARVKVLEEALDEIIAVPSVSEQNRVVQIARTALSQVREP